MKQTKLTALGGGNKHDSSIASAELLEACRACHSSVLVLCKVPFIYPSPCHRAFTQDSGRCRDSLRDRMPHRCGDLSLTSSLQNTSQCSSQQIYSIHFSLEGKLVAAWHPVSELRSKNARLCWYLHLPKTNLRAEPERSDCRPSWLSEYCLQPSSTFATFSQLQLSNIVPRTLLHLQVG